MSAEKRDALISDLLTLVREVSPCDPIWNHAMWTMTYLKQIRKKLGK